MEKFIVYKCWDKEGTMTSEFAEKCGWFHYDGKDAFGVGFVCIHVPEEDADNYHMYLRFESVNHIRVKGKKDG